MKVDKLYPYPNTVAIGYQSLFENDQFISLWKRTIILKIQPYVEKRMKFWEVYFNIYPFLLVLSLTLNSECICMTFAIK